MCLQCCAVDIVYCSNRGHRLEMYDEKAQVRGRANKEGVLNVLFVMATTQHT